jgi:hypothetical protein
MLFDDSQPLPDLLAWFAATPIARRVWQRLGGPEGSPSAWGERLLAELAACGAVKLRDGVAHNV